MAHEDFSLLRDIVILDADYGTATPFVKPFWKNTVLGEVSGKVVVVKLYNGRNGGKDALLRDLKYLAENL